MKEKFWLIISLGLVIIGFTTFVINSIYLIQSLAGK